jgi:EAL domain-containing protein (putative c-di-GMP-specific phosphodiesterase class I)
MRRKLDLHCLETAVNSFSELTLPAKSNIDYSKGIYELAVNVFPSTVMSEEFNELIFHIVKKGIFPGEKLVFEISERKEIPTPILFQKRLAEYSNSYRISFAIDDFGVGASSVSRLADLKISYVKLDAAIAKQDHNELTIQYVQQLVSERIASGKKVILEGYDRDSNLDLSILNELNLNLIQGYIIGPAQKDLMVLSDSLRSDLAQNYSTEGTDESD